MTYTIYNILVVCIAMFLGLIIGRFLRRGYPRATVSDSGIEVRTTAISKTSVAWADLRFAQIFEKRVLLVHGTELIVLERSTPGVDDIVRMVAEKKVPVLFESLLVEEDKSWAQARMSRQEMVAMRDMLVSKLGITNNLATSIAGLNAMDRNGA
jgi:hypothetical protein